MKNIYSLLTELTELFINSATFFPNTSIILPSSFFLILQEDGYEKHLLRTADLIQINTSIAKKNDKFALKNCKTHLQIKAVASGSTFFAGSKYLQEMKFYVQMI